MTRHDGGPEAGWVDIWAQFIPSATAKVPLARGPEVEYSRAGRKGSGVVGEDDNNQGRAEQHGSPQDGQSWSERVGGLREVEFAAGARSGVPTQAPEGAAYPALFAALLERLTAARSEAARTLGPVLTAHLKTMPQGTYAEKQVLAKWVNGQLRQLGLAVLCPKTGRAAIFLADHGPNPEKGRFQIQTVHDRKRTLSSVELPEFALVPADLRQDYVKSPRSRQSD